MLNLNEDLCITCGGCSAVCPKNCIMVYENWIEIVKNECIKCGTCVRICPVNALTL